MSFDTSAWCYNYIQMLILRQTKEVMHGEHTHYTKSTLLYNKYGQ